MDDPTRTRAGSGEPPPARMINVRRRDYGSGGLVERRPGRWHVSIELPPDPSSGRRRRRRFTVRGSRADAQRALNSALAARDQGIDLNPSRLLVRDYLEQWLDRHARISVRPSTLRRYEQIAGRLASLIGAITLRDLRAIHVQNAYGALLDDGLAPRTVLHHHRLLKQSLQQAVRWGLIPANPADAVAAPKAERREMRSLSADEVALLEDAVTDDDLARLFRVAVTTGLRLGELLGLRWSDIDLGNGRLHVQRSAFYGKGTTSLGSVKTGRSRRAVALSHGTVATLREHHAAQASRRLELGPAYRGMDLVFPSPDGSIMPPYRASNRFRAIADRVGLRGVRFHDLRHTMATLALSAGVHVKVVSERLGHSTTQITLDTYSHVLPDLQREAAEALDAALHRRREPAS